MILGAVAVATLSFFLLDHNRITLFPSAAQETSPHSLDYGEFALSVLNRCRRESQTASTAPDAAHHELRELGGVDQEFTPCLSAAFMDAALREGPERAQKALGFLRSAGHLGAACHDVLHHIGREIVSQGAFEDLLAAADPACDWGYLHGVLQEAVVLFVASVSYDEVAARIGDVCQRTSSLHKRFVEECFHGLGHGLAFANATDLVGTLVFCDAVGTGKLKRECHAGVFMELADPGGHVQAPPFYDPKDPVYPCTIVPEPYQEICYERIPERAQAIGMPLEGIIRLCATAPKEILAESCLGHVYAMVRGDLKTNEERVVQCRALGMAGAEYAAECFRRIAHLSQFSASGQEEFGVQATDREDFCARLLPNERTGACDQ